MTCIEEGRADPVRELQRLVVVGAASEMLGAVQRVEHGVKRLDRVLVAATGALARLVARLFFLQVRGVEHHQAGEFARGAGGDDFAAETATAQQRNASAVVEVRVREQQEIDLSRVESEVLGIFLVELAAALVKPAVDENPASGTFDEMTGAGYAAIGAVKGYLHVVFSLCVRFFTERAARCRHPLRVKPLFRAAASRANAKSASNSA